MERDRTDAAGSDGAEDQVVGLADILVVSLDALAEVGQADFACRAAGRACAVLRKPYPAQWRKFNALLHRISRHARSDEL